MKIKLRTRLTLSYALSALVLVLLITVLTNTLLERQFRSYIIRQQENRNLDIVQMVSRQYDPATGVWDHNSIGNIGVNALEQGLILKVTDSSGSSVWSATVHNSGLCATMIKHMSENMSSRYPNFKGSYTVKKYPLKQGSRLIGQAEIGYYGPYFLNDTDLAFINTLNKLLAAAGLLSLILAFVLGAFTAKRISAPIAEAIETARDIARGHFKRRTRSLSHTVEIDELSTTIDDLAQSLDQQEKLRKRLTSDVAHELRTPLTTLQTHIEAMIDGVWEADSARLSSCHEEIMRINRMVGDLEKLARFESEGLVLNRENFDLNELAGQIIGNHRALFDKQGLTLDFSGETAPIFADRDKIAQVMINLLSNAVKYTGQGGSVTVGVEEKGGYGLLIVKDTGIGIALEDLPFIFERFYRADPSRHRATGGAGIGLAIVKAIVVAHGGEISVESQPGEGTRFIVTLPAQSS